MIDTFEYKILDHGVLALLDIMGSDHAICEAARISYKKGKKSDDRKLIRYLMRHQHWSPFEMAEMKFYVKAPIFVFRQWARHRTATWNEISGRYSELPNDIFHPVTLYTQDKKNKQLSSDKEVVYQIKSYEKSYQEYQDMLDAGVSKEYSRIVLPLAIYSEMYWKCDLRNILHFIKLRMSPDAQGAIREYAKIMAEIVERCFPLTWEAFQDYELEAITFSKQELFLLKTLLNNKEIVDTKLDKSEQEEFNTKLKLLNSYE